MVNIETPVVPESPAILREILQNKVPISHEFLLTKSKMQATPADLITERENSSPKHVTRSDQDSEIGSDAESSFLDQSRVDETEVDEAKSDMDDNQSNAVTSGEENRDLRRARADKIESGHPHHYGDMEAMYGLNEVRRQKRKQSLPQQYEQDAKFRRLDGHPLEDDLWALRQQMSVVQNYFRHFDEGIPKPMNGYAGMENIHHLHQAYFANLQAARHAEVLQKEQQQNAQAKAVLGAFEKRVAIERDHYNIAEHVRETVNCKKGPLKRRV
ncbi:hypothetical protein DPMN_128812 [Dreissena polymorpha]|uniref:Uncharacterized protein n=1 Tax=Dreissena polymorpha TaxID=45954 RepID=A0A9D4H1I8_DREPO|nr:hypothetical protein DPMN_128812 [Dreissena polymorpha]